MRILFAIFATTALLARDIVWPDAIVTAARIERPAERTPAHVTVIDRERISNTAAISVPQLLRQVSGIQVGSWTAGGRNATIDVRGFGETASANTLVLVDGRRINNPDLGGIDWTTIPLARIERIEIIRGGRSVLYGDNAVGGVINIITDPGATGNEVRVETRIASFQSQRHSLNAEGSDGALSYALDLSYQDGDGYRENSYFRNRSGGLHLGIDPGDWWAFTLAAGAKQDHYGLPGAVAEGSDPEAASTPLNKAESNDRYLRLAPEFRFSERTQLRLALNHREFEPRASFGGFIVETRLQQIGLSAQLDTRQKWAFEHQLSLGIETMVADQHGLSSFAQDVARRESALFAYDQIALIPDRLFLDLGYRTARVNYDFADSATTDDVYDLSAGSLGISWQLSDERRVFASVDRAYRAMLIQEEFGHGSVLPPQISHHWQLGARHEDKTWTVAVTGFAIDTRDEIFYNPDFGVNTNYPRTQRRGVEIEFGWRPTENLEATASYTWQRGELERGNFDGNEIPGTAPQYGAVGVNWRLCPRASIDLRGRWAKNRTLLSDWTNAGDWGDSYFVVDATVTTQLTEHIELFAGVNNLFAEEYADFGLYLGSPFVYPAARRNGFCGVRYRRPF